MKKVREFYCFFAGIKKFLGKKRTKSDSEDDSEDDDVELIEYDDINSVESVSEHEKDADDYSPPVKKAKPNGETKKKQILSDDDDEEDQPNSSSDKKSSKSSTPPKKEKATKTLKEPKAKVVKQLPKRSPAKKPKYEVDSDEDDDDFVEEKPKTKELPKRSPSKKKTYVVDSDEDEDVEINEDDDDSDVSSILLYLKKLKYLFFE